jgi:hypothetical protein
MPNKKGTGLLMVWVDVQPDKEEEFNRWYNEEHLAERLSIPGILSAARYEAVSSGPKHLACYELESAEVTRSPEYRKFRENPTEWTKRMGPNVVGTVYIRNVYEMIHPEKLTPEIARSGMAPALQIGRMDIPAEIEDEWNDWYNNVYVPNYMKVPGCIRGRRYRAVVGEPKYLTLYEFENPDVSKTQEWMRQRDIDSRNEQMRRVMQHVPGSPGIWKKTFEITG